MDTLTKIKKLVIARRVVFTDKAISERVASGLSTEDVFEAIINAVTINKTIRSTSLMKRKRKERLYVIIGSTYDGKMVYTKGTIRKHGVEEEFYIFVSSKWSVYEN